MINTAHIIVTEKCGNTCPLCCNNNYVLAEIPYITKEELEETKAICLTGGEPFLCKDIDKYIKTLRKYVGKLYVYASGYELLHYIEINSISNRLDVLKQIDGFSISPKTIRDWNALNGLLKYYGSWLHGKENRLYAFIEDPGSKNYTLQVDVNKPFNEISPYIYETISECAKLEFNIYFRTWQDEIVSPEDEIFRNIKIDEF